MSHKNNPPDDPEGEEVSELASKVTAARDKLKQAKKVNAANISELEAEYLKASRIHLKAYKKWSGLK